MDYSKTLNLPATEFPMRGNLPNREPEFLDFWEKNEIYTKKQLAYKLSVVYNYKQGSNPVNKRPCDRQG